MTNTVPAALPARSVRSAPFDHEALLIEQEFEQLAQRCAQLGIGREIVERYLGSLLFLRSQQSGRCSAS